jgi:Ca2+-transporting ATPase
VTVYARVTAEHKLRIVRAWKANGAVVAMTGDGVNDAPALKEASIGIAMGIAGTEVTKEASDLVITDDNFASIVAAVEEGRGIYDNILKTLGYLVAGNAGELTVMLVAGLLGWPLPLLPIQLLWVNLVTDGFRPSPWRPIQSTGRCSIGRLGGRRAHCWTAPRCADSCSSAR